MKTINVLTFAFGVVVGSCATAAVVNQYYKQKLDKTLKQAYDDFYSNKPTEESKEDPVPVSESEADPIKKSYQNELAKYRYSDILKKGGEPVTAIKPYAISPEEFEEPEEKDKGDYDKISLTYYSNGILADEQDDIIDPDESVGRDFSQHFGEYEQDAVYIRNEVTQTDYEVTRDLRTYEEVTGRSANDTDKA